MAPSLIVVVRGGRGVPVPAPPSVGTVGTRATSTDATTSRDRTVGSLAAGAPARSLDDHLDAYAGGGNGRQLIAPVGHRPVVASTRVEVLARNELALLSRRRCESAKNPPNLGDLIGHETAHSREQLWGSGDSVVAVDTELEQPRL